MTNKISKQHIIKVTDGSTVGYQVPLHPSMLTEAGVKQPSSVDNVVLQLGREYVVSKLKKEFIDVLGIRTKDDFDNLLVSAFN